MGPDTTLPSRGPLAPHVRSSAPPCTPESPSACRGYPVGGQACRAGSVEVVPPPERVLRTLAVLGACLLAAIRHVDRAGGPRAHLVRAVRARAATRTAASAATVPLVALGLGTRLARSLPRKRRAPSVTGSKGWATSCVLCERMVVNNHDPWTVWMPDFVAGAAGYLARWVSVGSPSPLRGTPLVGRRGGSK